MVVSPELPTSQKRPVARFLARYGWQALILLCAGIPRLGWLGLAEFKGDESHVLLMAEGIARGQSYPLIGIGSSLGIPNAPFFVYLMAVPELLSREAIVATGFVALLDVAAVLLSYYFVARYFDRPTAVTAALLFAVSPWAIIFSRKVWEQDALPLFVTLGFFALFEALLNNWPKGVFFGLTFLTLAFELHPTGLFLFAPAGILILGCLVADGAKPRLILPWLGVGIAAAVGLELPFLLWNARNGWPLLAVFGHLTGDRPTIDLTAARLALSVAAGNGYPSLALVNNLWRPASLIEVPLLLGGIALTVYEVLTAASRPRRFAGAAMLVWLATPILLQTRHTVPLYPHYFIVLYPAPFLLMGRTVSAMLRLSSPKLARIRQVAPLLVLMPVAIGMFTFGNYLTALSGDALAPQYGIPLARQEAWIAQLNASVNGGAVYFGTRDIDLATSFAYLSDHRWQIFDSQLAPPLAMPIPGADQPALLILVDDSSPAEQLVSRAFGPAQPQRVNLPGGPEFLVYRFANGKVDGTSAFRNVGAQFSDGLTLIGYRVTTDTANRQLHVDLRWRFGKAVPGKPPTVFNHVLDPKGVTVAQRDGIAYSPGDWRAGEEFIAEFLLNEPTTPGPYTLQVGLYDYPSMRRFGLIQPPAGAPTDALNLSLGNDVFPVGLTPPAGQG